MSGQVTELRGGVGKRVRQDGSYRFVIVYRDRDGRKQAETLPPGHNRKTATLERNQRVAEASRGVAPGTMTLTDFLPVWDASIDGRLQPQTVYGYRGLVRNHIRPGFGRRQLRELRPSVVQDWLDRGAGRDLSAAMQRKVIGCLSVVLKAASVRDLAEPVSFDMLVAKKAESDEMRALSLEELVSFAERFDDWYRPDIIWLGVTGLRRGEHTALRSSDIDLPGRLVRVERTVDRFGSIGPTKNPWSTRSVQLFQHAADAVQVKRELRLRLGIPGAELFWTTRHGGVLSWPNFHRDQWRKHAVTAGLGRLDADGHYHGLRVHDLRHTAASLMIAAGLDIGFVSRQLGHKNTIITQSVYAHWLEARSPLMVDRYDQAYTQEQR